MRTKILPKITPKQQEIILLLFKFRFLNRTQIQKLLGHKDHRPINSWLKDLSEKEYVERIYSNSFPENTKPAIYYLANNGIGYLKTEAGRGSSALKNLYSEKLRTGTFIDRCTLLADIYLDLKNRETDKLKFNINLASDYDKVPERDLLEGLNPAVYLIQKKSGQIKYYFIEILADLPTQWLRQRIKRYLKLYESSEWEAETNKSFPTILIICPNYRVMDYVLNYIRKQLANLDEPELSINLTIVEKIKEFGLTGDVWKVV